MAERDSAYSDAKRLAQTAYSYACDRPRLGDEEAIAGLAQIAAQMDDAAGALERAADQCQQYMEEAVSEAEQDSLPLPFLGRWATWRGAATERGLWLIARDHLDRALRRLT